MQENEHHSYVYNWKNFDIELQLQVTPLEHRDHLSSRQKKNKIKIKIKTGSSTRASRSLQEELHTAKKKRLKRLKTIGTSTGASRSLQELHTAKCTHGPRLFPAGSSSVTRQICFLKKMTKSVYVKTFSLFFSHILTL